MLGHIADNLMYVALFFSILVIVGILVYPTFRKFLKPKKRDKKSTSDVTDRPSQIPENISNLNSFKRKPEIPQPSGTPQQLTDRESEKATLGNPNVPSQTPENTADNLNDSSDLKLLLEKLLEEIKGIRASLNRIEDIFQGQGLFQTPNSSSHSTERVVEKPPQRELMSPSLQKFCDLYNAGVQNSQQRRNLQENYQLNYRIGVVNANERRRASNTPPIFESDTAGDLLAFYIEAERLYAIVPYYGLTLGNALHGPGAFGKVFEYPNFDPQHSYRFEVIQPAFFEPDHEKQKWTLQKKGELKLDLGPGE